ncbi:AimR family lysis-lysogeny pheromone receptor [Bacillus sp. FSL W7-1360]
MGFLEQFVMIAIEEQGLSAVALAGVLGWPVHVLMRFFTKGEIEFEKAVTLFRHVHCDKWYELMDEYCLSVTNSADILHAFEYASAYNRPHVTDRLLQIHSDRNDISHWRYLYRVERMRHAYTLDDALDVVRELTGKEEMKVKVLLLKTQLYAENGDLTTAGAIAKKAVIKMNKLSDSFMRKSLKMRANCLLAESKLFVEDETEEALAYANKVIDSPFAPVRMVAASMRVKGLSYMYTSYNKSISYIEEAVRLYEYAGEMHMAEKMMKEDLARVKNVHQQIFEEAGLEGEELAHQYIVRGEKDRALNIIRTLRTQSPYARLYRSWIENNIDGVIQSQHYFAKHQRAFDSRLCTKVLRGLCDKSSTAQ